MQPWQGAQAHSSLPAAPHLSAQGGYQPQYAQSHPQQQWQYGVSSHYAQAYMQHNYASGSHAMPTYTPQASTSRLQLPNAPPSSGWYQPGSIRCRKQGCSFIGSQKAVETHMMDRHLIFPPGWEHRKRKDDWDADPSLKGKKIPIQGTTLKLDTPEAIEQWIAERMKRFPTATRVQEKQQKMQEAIARGQLALPEQRFPNKKRRLDNERLYVPGRRGKTREQFRGRGRGGLHAQRMRDISDNAQATTTNSAPDTSLTGGPPLHVAGRPDLGGASLPDKLDDFAPTTGSDSDSDAPPEVASSKPPVGERLSDNTSVDVASERRPAPLRVVRKPQPKQPRQPPQNPFASRPALLRNLLLPEIKMTVSNLSQAIRFLVDNDFLENVELKPGQAERKMIQVINESTSTADEPTSTSEKAQAAS